MAATTTKEELEEAVEMLKHNKNILTEYHYCRPEKNENGLAACAKQKIDRLEVILEEHVLLECSIHITKDAFKTCEISENTEKAIREMHDIPPNKNVRTELFEIVLKKGLLNPNSDEDLHYYLCPTLWKFEHSCNPNCIVVFLPNNTVRVTTLTTIEPGEKLTVSHFPCLFATYATRDKLFDAFYKRPCSCELCATGSSSIENQRRDLLCNTFLRIQSLYATVNNYQMVLSSRDVLYKLVSGLGIPQVVNPFTVEIDIYIVDKLITLNVAKEHYMPIVSALINWFKIIEGPTSKTITNIISQLKK